MSALHRRAAEVRSAGTFLAVRELAAWLSQQDFPGPQARDANGETPLMRAAWQGEDGVVEALLAHGSDPGAVNDDGNNALWFACLHGGPATILRLVGAGTPIDHANDDDVTCLKIGRAHV